MMSSAMAEPPQGPAADSTSPPASPILEVSDTEPQSPEKEQGCVVSVNSSPNTTGNLSSGAQALTMAAARQIMLENYTPWVMSTYGDSAKTKTITTKKYKRIVNLLRSLDKDLSGAGGSNGPTGSGSGSGSEPSGSEAAKFRVWVKGKGFHLGPPAGHPDYGRPQSSELLYLPTGTDKVRTCTYVYNVCVCV